MGQHTTGEKVSELLFDERRQADALGVVSARVQERIQMRFDDTVQRAAFGVARSIRGGWHARDIRPAHGLGQCPMRDTSKALGGQRERTLSAGRPLPETPTSPDPCQLQNPVRRHSTAVATANRVDFELLACVVRVTIVTA